MKTEKCLIELNNKVTQDVIDIVNNNVLYGKINDSIGYSFDIASKNNNVNDNKEKEERNKKQTKLVSLTNNERDALYFLSDKNITSMIMTGAESVRGLLFPLLQTVFEGDKVTSKEKNDLVNRLKKDIKQCDIYLKQEFQEEYIERAKEGIECFKKEINNLTMTLMKVKIV